MERDLFLQHGTEVDLPTAVRYMLRLGKSYCKRDLVDLFQQHGAEVDPANS